MTVYERLAKMKEFAIYCADGQKQMLDELREGSDMALYREKTMKDYLKDAETLGLVMDNLPVEIAEREI